MSITKLFSTLGLLALSFAVAGTAMSVASKPLREPPPEAKAVDPKMSHHLDCAKACDDCARYCNLCAAHCAKLAIDGKKEHAETLRICADCAIVCTAASAVVVRTGPFTDLIAIACAEACKRCGDACEKFAAQDAIMKKCAEECHNCEKACRGMLKQTVKP